MNISLRQQEILRQIMRKGALQSSDVRQALIANGSSISLISVKRDLSEMTRANLLVSAGGGRYVKYDISTIGRVFSDINAKKYTLVEPDKRYGLDSYNFELFIDFPICVFDYAQIKKLDVATKEFRNRTKSISDVVQEKELQRLIIELSWKSSRIEGNTYTLLDTEKLILEAQEATGHDKSEAVMILNHKDAFNFIRDNQNEFKDFNLKYLEKVHSMLVEGLGVSKGLRNSLVGITGSRYRPLDNIFKIKEAVTSLSQAINRAKDPYTKAILALVGISYIQPFEDGNKRTGRLMANAILLAYGCTPLSYRSVEENEYREAILVFYELNSIMSFEKIFIEQYLFAAENYSVK
jgi:fido (protein-threonine AMPylation protein)